MYSAQIVSQPPLKVDLKQPLCILSLLAYAKKALE